MTTFHVIEITRTFNRRGAVVATAEREVAKFARAIDATAYRFERCPRDCHWVEINDRRSVTLETRNAEGANIGFQDVFRMVEGEDAYEAVLAGRAPPVAEVTWIASKMDPGA